MIAIGKKHSALLALAVASICASQASQAQTACNVTHRINQVQGSGTSTPLNGATVTIEGVVVADFQSIPQNTRSGELRGFFIQEEQADQDADPNTSEGIFVYTPTPTLDVAEGQRICVTGAVSEFFGLTEITATAANSLVRTATSATLPPAAELTLPIIGNVDAYLEKFEGMRVHFAQPLFVSEYFEMARYGQIVLTAGARPFQYTHGDSTPTAAEYQAFLADLDRKRIILDDGDNVQNGPLPSGKFYFPFPNGFGIGTQGVNYFRGGDTINDLTGVLHWSFAGLTGTDAWRIRPTVATPAVFTVANPRPAAAPSVGGNVRVTAFNVLNYFTTIDTTSSDSSGPCGPSHNLDCRGADSAAELARQEAKLTTALRKSGTDVIGLMEIENNGTAVATLATRLNASSPGANYQHVQTGVIGTDAITVALLYNADTVTPVGAPAILTAQAFVDPNNTGLFRNRPAVAQTFEVTGASNPDKGAKFTVVVNHLKSKGADGSAGADADQGDGQSAWNSTRTKAAAYLVNTWLPTDPTGQGDPDYLIVGDLNAYKGETPITAIRNAGYTDLHQAFEGNDAYSYVFDGQLGYLDHALANASILPQITGFATWRINSDEVPVFDYNDTVKDTGEAAFEAEPTGNPLYEANEFRTSDHDPVIIGLDLTTPLLRGDADGDGDIDSNDINLIVAARNQTATSNDARDVNADGVINAVDARLAATRCTRAQCATG
jgi:predicted extracellular nuclease